MRTSDFPNGVSRLRRARQMRWANYTSICGLPTWPVPHRRGTAVRLLSRPCWTRMRRAQSCCTATFCNNAQALLMSSAVPRRSAAPVPAALAPIPFIDLQAQRRRIAPDVERAIARVLEHGQFIMGPEIAELERALADYCGVKHALACGSGTDALLLLLLAQGVGPGDAVFC